MAKRRSARSEPDLEDDDDDDFAWQPKPKKKKKKRSGSTSSAGKSGKRKRSATSSASKKSAGSSVNRSGRRKSKRASGEDEGESSTRRRRSSRAPARKKSGGNPVILISIVTVTILICLIVVVSSNSGGGTEIIRDEPAQMEKADALAEEGMTAFHQWTKAVRAESNPQEENRLNRLARHKLTEAMDTLNSALDPYRDADGMVNSEYEGWELRLGDWSKHMIDLEKGARTDAGH